MELISGEEGVQGSSASHRRTSSTLASAESLSMPHMQEVVLSADFGCVECRKRIAEVMSRMTEVESMTVSLRERTVTLSCRYSYPAADLTAPAPAKQVPAVCSRKSFNKMALIKKIFRGTFQHR